MPGTRGRRGDNFPGHRKYESTGWQCQACVGQVREDQDHLILCPGYTDLFRDMDRDINSDKELVELYSLVIARRRENGWD